MTIAASRSVTDGISPTATDASHRGENQNPKAEARYQSVLLLDPCLMTRQCLEQMLQVGVPEFSVSSAATYAEATGLAPNLVVWNIRTLRMSGPEVVDQLSEIRHQYDHPDITVISDLDEPLDAIHAIRCGCRGYIPTTMSLELTLAAIRVVLAGGIFIPESAIDYSCNIQDEPGGSFTIDRDELQALSAVTKREDEVLQLLQQGKQNKTIAFELDISESTVKIHVRNLMRKLGAKNRTQAALLTREGMRPDATLHQSRPPSKELGATKMAGQPKRYLALGLAIIMGLSSGRLATAPRITGGPATAMMSLDWRVPDRGLA